MKLATALRLTGMNRATFNSLHRDGSLEFMERSRPEGRWELAFENLLALAAWGELRASGVSPKIASEAIKAGWADIERAAKSGSPDDEPRFVGLVRTPDGLDYIGWGSKEGPDLWRGAIVTQAVNLINLAHDLRRRLSDAEIAADEED